MMMCHFGQISERLHGKPFTEWKPIFAWALEAYPCCAGKVRNYYVYQYQLGRVK